MSFLIEDRCLKKYTGNDEVIYIPSNVNAIDSYAFMRCPNLKKIVCPEGLEILSYAAFSGCDSVEEIELPYTLKTIGEECFEYCSHLKTITIPEGVESIDSAAFKGCFDLTKVYIAGARTNIAEDNFSDCKNLKLNNELLIFNGTCFGGCGQQGQVEIPEGVLKIAPYAFDGMNISSITVPSTVAEICNDAFRDCSLLSEVKLHEGLTAIGTSAFYGCKILKHITLPQSLERMGYAAFEFCTALNHIVIPPRVTSLPCNLFEYCWALDDIVIPPTVKYIGEHCFDSCGFSSWTTPPNVEEFGDFYISGGLRQLHVAASEKSVRDFAFSLCRGLQELYVDDSITQFGRDYLGSTVPYIHISAKGISPLSDENKINAVITFLKDPDSYSEVAQKDWRTYIRRRKMDIFSHLLQLADEKPMEHYLQIVTFTSQQASMIQDMAQSSGLINTIKQFTQVKPAKTIAVNTHEDNSKPSKVAQLISTTSKRASEFKKVVLLEAAVLFGSTEDVQAVLDRYQSFECLNRAICLCVQTSDLNKLEILLQSKGTFVWTNSSGQLTAKYGTWDRDILLRNLIEPAFVRPKYLDWSAEDYEEHDMENPYHTHTDIRPILLRDINSTFQKTSGITFTESEMPVKSHCKHLEALKMVAEWVGDLAESRCIAYALFHGCVPLAKSIINSGISLNPHSIHYMFGTDYPESRRDVFYALSIASEEDRIFIWDCLMDAAHRCGEKIVLSSVLLDYVKGLLDSNTIEIMLSECDWRKLKAYDFMVQLIMCEMPECLDTYLNSSICHVNRDTITALLNFSDYRQNHLCSDVLKNHL